MPARFFNNFEVNASPKVAVTVFEWKFVCGAYRLMEYHLDFNSRVFLLKSGAKNISLNFQMVFFRLNICTLFPRGPASSRKC